MICRENSEISTTHNENSLYCDLEESTEKDEKSNEIVNYNNLKKEDFKTHLRFNYEHIWEVIQSMMNENQNKPGLRVEV